MQIQNLLSFFTDPILRAPTIGCMLMCLGASLVGVIVFLRKQSLIGEVLSHAAYPGVILGTLFAGLFFIQTFEELKLALFALTGAFVTSLLGLWLINVLEDYYKVPSDAALCFVLSTFFGIGLTIASQIQFSFTGLYKQVLTYLYGQAATMTDSYIIIYGLLALAISFVVLLLYKEIQVITFDKHYAKSLGINIRWFNIFIYILVTLAVIIGIRSVGVVLMSAMLIAPAAAARQFTHRLSIMFLLAGFFGLLSGFLGVYFSVNITDHFMINYPASRLIIPTGPMIVLVASSICIGALLFAPERGLMIRLVRIAAFRYRCIGENILKAIWRIDPESSLDLDQLVRYQACSKRYLKFILWRLCRQGWLNKGEKGRYFLTTEGKYKAARIVRLHRLWEVYLVEYLGIGVERVHKNAEEMEHILTPEVERELTQLLNNPKRDPHHQPIPPPGGL